MELFDIKLVGLNWTSAQNPARLTTAMGLVTAGLAVALQNVVTSVAGYFVILRGKNFSVGDRPGGEEFWVMLGWNSLPEEWSAQRAAQVFGDGYWRDWSASLQIENAGERAARLRRSAITVQLLSSAQHDSTVAALTISLPECLGGDRNYDYRYAWVRDASLALLARLGRIGEVRTYLDWLCRLRSTTNAPLQVCYRLDGNPHLEQEEFAGVRGYEDSQPVRRGNRAAKQMQLGSLGFFADCARIYVENGGEWREEFWHLLKRAADFICEYWQEKDSGVWELPQEAHYVVSRVMSWVVLTRAVSIAEKTGHADETDHWRETARTIHTEVMDKGWCEEKNSFRSATAPMRSMPPRCSSRSWNSCPTTVNPTISTNPSVAIPERTGALTPVPTVTARSFGQTCTATGSSPACSRSAFPYSALSGPATGRFMRNLHH